MRAFPRRQRGQIIVLVALSIFVLLSTVALALDAGLSYTVKAKLNAATDAASLAAARAVSHGDGEAAQRENARKAAQRFFDANFPATYMLSTATMNEPVITFDPDGKVTVDITASAAMPISLLGVVNSTPLAPGALTRTERKDLDMVLVMDTSGSLKGSAKSVRASGISFLNKFNTTQDRVGLLRFSYGAVVDDPISTSDRGFDLASMVGHITNYQFDGSTASAEGMWNARDQLNKIPAGNKRSNLRVIVFFSDGAPNSFGSYFEFKNPEDCKRAGTIATGDATSAHYPIGLYYIDRIATPLPGGCTPDRYTPLTSLIAKLPDWYNAHNTKQEFRIVTDSPREVTSDVSNETVAWRNVNRAARNLAEAIASKARDERIYVFTLGLGSQLKAGTGPDGEKGEDVLKCMANTPDSGCFKAGQPVGVYCYAATDNDLTPCFSKLASAILRISK